MTNESAIERKLRANAIRILAADAVEKANSGHPGMPMGMADIAEVLWNDVLRHNPKNPDWFNRDRFILSNGHGSMLHYALLHLSGYALSMEEIRQFRQLHSQTPGHPEYKETPGIETTTGPLGQGISNAVGMAIAERFLRQRFNRPGLPLVDHHIYTFLGDGCLMEGISHESCSLAGTLGLGKLIAFWDDNGISIDGEVKDWFTDDTEKRFRAYDWQVLAIDGHDSNAILKAIAVAKKETNKPTLIACKTVIGYGSPNKGGKASSHGAALGEDELARVRATLEWSHPSFEIPDAVYGLWRNVKGADSEQQWNDLFSKYNQQYPDLGEQFKSIISGVMPSQWEDAIDAYISQSMQETVAEATRKCSQNTLNAFASSLPQLIGGSADLTGSNNTNWSRCEGISESTPDGNYLYYGVREFAMAAIMNGMATYGIIPYGGTFLTFSDYSRNAIRMAALMGLRVIHVLSHDSIGLGEDGPTHQPIEHATSLRLIPNLQVWRPCDATETAIAWKASIQHSTGPSCLLLSRQKLPQQNHDLRNTADVERGGYVLWEAEGEPELIIIATGSEVALAVESACQSSADIRVISMPCADRFIQQEKIYQESVLPTRIRKRIAIEAGVSDYWYRFVGLDGIVIGIDEFGRSAPAEQLFEFFDFTVNRINQAIEDMRKR